MKRFTFSFVLSIFLNLLAGQGVFLHDTIQISTSNIPLKISETGRSITVLNAEDIKRIPANSIDELLQTVVGLEVQSRGGFGTQADITMRGSTFTQVLILLDGMKLNDPLTGHFNGYFPVAMAEIERIEVLRGAASAMYGPDAVGGVINIVSKTFSSARHEDQTEGNLYYGSNKTINGQMGFYNKAHKLDVSGGINFLQSAGEIFPERMIDTSTTLTGYNSYFNIATVGASANYHLNEKTSIKLRSSFDSRDFDARYYYTTSVFDKSTEIVNNWWNQFQIQNIASKSSTDFNVAHKINTDEFIFSPDFPSTNNHTSKFTNITLNHLRELAADLKFKTGLQIDRRSIVSNDRGDHNDMHYGFYGMAVYQKSNLNTSLNLRFDYDQNYGFEWLPSLNVSYVLPKIVVRASIGKSIRAADYTERYVSNNLLELTPGRSLGNPELKAERSWSEEIGVDFSFSKNWIINTTFFARQSQNLIDYTLTNQDEIGSVSSTGSLQAGADYFFAKNISEVNTIGFEFNSNLKLALSKGTSLSWIAAYTNVNTSNSEDLISVYISSHANHLFSNNLSLNLGIFDIGLTALYKDRDMRIASAINSELEESYLLLNGQLGFQIHQSLKANFQIRNMFDTDYQNILGAPMPGRWLLAGVSWNI